MALINIGKDKVGLEDIDFGIGTSVQTRGTITKINGANIPYDGVETINQAIDRKEDIIANDAKLSLKADLNGNALEIFKVSQALANDDAVPKSQMDTADALKADLTYVDTELATKADEINVLLKDGTSPTFSPTSGNQPATKKYVDDQVIAAGAGDMTKSIYDTANTGAVDTSEAIGRTGTFLGQTPMHQVMRLCQSNISDCNAIDDFGIFIGTDVANAPTTGIISLEQISITGGADKIQRCFSFNTTLYYIRKYTGTIWSPWSVSAQEDNVVNKTGDTMSGNLDLLNNIPINSYTVGAVLKHLLSIDSSDNVVLGNIDLPTLVKGITSFPDSIPTVGVVQGVGVNELTRKDYVDTADALKADITYVDSENALQDTEIATKETPAGAQAKVDAHAAVKSAQTVFGHAEMYVSSGTLYINTL